jgi:hypothetical protein
MYCILFHILYIEIDELRVYKFPESQSQLSSPGMSCVASIQQLGSEAQIQRSKLPQDDDNQDKRTWFNFVRSCNVPRN